MSLVLLDFDMANRSYWVTPSTNRALNMSTLFQKSIYSTSVVANTEMPPMLLSNHAVRLGQDLDMSW